MKIESYSLMKTTFDYYRSDLFNYFNSGGRVQHIIYFNEQLNMIQSGWMYSTQETDCIYIVLNTDEFNNFNEKIYTEKVILLTKKLKEYYVNKKLQDIEGDFEE